MLCIGYAQSATDEESASGEPGCEIRWLVQGSDAQSRAADGACE